MSPQSYLYLNGCTNYGGNIAVAIESSSCSSEATGRGSGIAGLLISAALDRVDAGTLQPRRIDPTGAVHPLSADEVAQLLTMTADDIDFSSSDRSVSFILSSFGIQSRRYASQPGWDEYFGYGRANAHQGGARPSRVTPCRRRPICSTPDWWETLDPGAHAGGDGHGRGGRDARRQLRLGAVRGLRRATRPRTASRRSRPPAASPRRSVPARWRTWSIGDTALRCAIDVDGVAHTAPSGTASPDDTPDIFTVTLRLRVTDDAGRRGEARRTLYLHHDPDLRRGFPLAIGGSGEPSPFFVRLRGKAPRSGRAQRRAAAADRSHLRRPHPRAALRRPRAAGLARAHRPAAAPHRLARVHQRRAADDVLRIGRRRRRGGRPRRRPAHRDRGGHARRQALRVGARRHAARAGSRCAPSRASPPAARATASTGCSRVCSRRPCSPTSTATARSRSSPPPWTATSTSGARTAARSRAGRCWSSIARRWRRSTR